MEITQSELAAFKKRSATAAAAAAAAAAGGNVGLAAADVSAVRETPLALRLLNTLKNNTETIAPKKLFATKCPRICVALKDTNSGESFAHEVANPSNPSALVAAILLAAARRTETTASERTFRNAYSWWFNKASASSGFEIQKSVLKALNYDYASVLSNATAIPRCLSYIEDSSRLWIFFVDGRVDFASLLCTSGEARLCAPPPPGTTGTLESSFDSTYDKAVKSAIDLCNKTASSVSSTVTLFSSAGVKTAFPGSESDKVLINTTVPLVRALARFTPAENGDFHNSENMTTFDANPNATRTSFTRVECSRTVPMNLIFALPAPRRRRDFIESTVSKFAELETKTAAIEEAMKEYAQTSERMRALQGGTNTNGSFAAIAASRGHDATDSLSEERACEEIAREAVRDPELEGVSKDCVETANQLSSLFNGDEKLLKSVAARTNAPDDKNADKAQITVFHEFAEEFDINDEYELIKSAAQREADLADNVKIHVGNSAIYSGRMRDVFGAARAQEGEMNFHGISSLYSTSPAAAAAYDANMKNFVDPTLPGSNGNKLNPKKKIESMSANGIAMKEQFMAMNVLRKYQEANEKELLDIATTYERESPEYQSQMNNFKRRALKEASDAFFGLSEDSDKVSTPIKESVKWLNTLDNQLPEMFLIMKHATKKEAEENPDRPTFGPFANFIMHLMHDLDTAFTPDSLMEDAILLVLTSMAGAWHHDNLRPNVLLSGEASVGKSYILAIATALVPDGVSFTCTHETDKAGLVNGMRTDLLQTFEELPQHMLGVDEFGKEREVGSHQKDRLTSRNRTTYSLEIVKNPETGESDRRTRVFHCCEEMARHAATNAKLPPARNAALVRWILRTIKHCSDPDHSIMDLVTALKRSNPPERCKGVVDHWKLFFTIQLYIEKMIEANAISNVNMDAITELSDLLRHVTTTYNFKIDDPKILNKMMGFARLTTVSYAVYAAVCSEAGRALRQASFDGKKHNLQSICIDLALEVEKHLVLTREIVVYTFSLLRSEWMPAIRLEILQTLREIYIDGKAGFETVDHHNESTLHSNIVTANRELGSAAPVSGNKFVPPAGSAPRAETTSAKSQIKWCGPPDSRIREYDPEGLYEDSTFVMIKDVNGSTKIHDIATRIVQGMKHRQISKDAVIRELYAMMQVNTESPILVHPYNCVDRDRTKPQVLRDRITGEIVTQNTPLFFCGKLPPSSTMKRTAPALAIGGFGGGVGAFAHGVQRNNYHGGGGGLQNESRGGGHGDHNGDQYNYQIGVGSTFKPIQTEDFACMILFDAIFAPTDQTKIIEDATRSLAHKYMLGSQQTFVISGPTEIDIPYPPGTEPTGKAPGSVYRKTIYTIPRMFTIHKINMVRMLFNPKPLLPYQLAIGRIGENGARHRLAMRTCASEGLDSQKLLLCTDPDAAAMGAHHEKIGIDPDPNIHWTFFARRLCAEHERLNQPYITLEEMIAQHVDTWRSNQMSTMFAKRKNLTHEDCAEVAAASGCSEASGLRFLTPHQMEIAADGDYNPVVGKNYKKENFFSILSEGEYDLVKRRLPSPASQPQKTSSSELISRSPLISSTSSSSMFVSRASSSSLSNSGHELSNDGAAVNRIASTRTRADKMLEITQREIDKKRSIAESSPENSNAGAATNGRYSTDFFNDVGTDFSAINAAANVAEENHKRQKIRESVFDRLHIMSRQSSTRPMHIVENSKD